MTDHKKLAYSYPLRRDFMVQIVVPLDLTTAEAKRLKAFLLTLAQPEEGDDRHANG